MCIFLKKNFISKSVIDIEVMMMSSSTFSSDNHNKIILKQLKQKACDFLSSRKCANNIVDIIHSLEESINNGGSLTSKILTLEYVFSEVLKRQDMVIEVEPLKPKDTSPEIQYREWLQERYKETCSLLLHSFVHPKEPESLQGLVSSMKLLILESRYPLDNNANEFPIGRLKNILMKLLSYEKDMEPLILRLQEYSVYYDLVYFVWKIMPSLTPRCGGAILYTNNNIFIKNFLNLINSSIIITLNSNNCNNNNSNGNTSGHNNSNGKNGYHNYQRYEDRDSANQTKYIIYDDNHPGRLSFKYDYAIVRRSMNKIWNCVMLWNYNNDEVIHRQILIILLEKVLTHLDKPLLMTDFLMESLDIGGPISLLALQGIFLLIQHHNLTYPDIYEKLYSMFEPEIFHTKFKARLFYLADIFLTSSHLPENLVAAFVKRLSRLSLVAPPQDIQIILYFIGNLILRHPGLKCLIYNSDSGGTNGGLHFNVVPRDPYIMDERKPTESKALESSLWEISTLQYHALPSISTAAKFISNPLPTQEWDLSAVLELNEDDIFDQEIKRNFNNQKYPLNYEKVNSLFLPKDDKIKQYWKLF